MTSFSDDFNRPDSSDLGPGWVEVSGDWSIVSGRLAPDTSSGTTILRAATTMASSDHYAQFTIVATTAASQGVWCRGNSNISSGYLWRTNGSSWDLFAVVGGSFTMIGTWAVAVAPGDVARVQAVGSTIKGFVNGVERVSVINTAVPTGVNVGLRIMAVPNLRFDDFTAADVTAGVALGTVSSTETAQPLTGAKAVVLGPATESGGAQPLTGTKTATLLPVAEQNSAQTLARVKAGALGTAEAVETAQPLAPAVGLPTAHTVEAAQPLAGGKTATLPVVLEADTARPLARQSTATPSPDRTYRIPADERRLVVAAETRTFTVR